MEKLYAKLALDSESHLLFVKHSNGFYGSLHKGCNALQYMQAAKKLPCHWGIHYA